MKQLLLTAALLAALVIVNDAPLRADDTEQVRFGDTFNAGVVYIGIPDIHKSWQELPKIKAEGFRHVNLPADPDEIPAPGTELRRRLDMLLDWCDRNGLDVWIEHNLQYGNPSRGGDREQACIDPVAYAGPHFEQWIDVLKGHPCVAGIGLGNETGASWPRPGMEQEMPTYLAAWRAWLIERHGDLASLNAAWGTNHKDTREIGFPDRKTHTEWIEIDGHRVPTQVIDSQQPGFIDLQRFAKFQFGRFYGRIFDDASVRTRATAAATTAGPAASAQTARRSCARATPPAARSPGIRPARTWRTSTAPSAPSRPTRATAAARAGTTRWAATTCRA